jgi:hypothetical protein
MNPVFPQRNLYSTLEKCYLLRLSRPVDQGHEHLLLDPNQFPHRRLDLGVFSPVAHLPNPFRSVALVLRQGLVVFDDLSDSPKVGANLRLGARLLQTI